MWVGQVFRGRVVDGKGEAVANAEIEVNISMLTSKTLNSQELTNLKKLAMVLRGDEEGYLSVPVRAGYCGFWHLVQVENYNTTVKNYLKMQFFG